MKYIGITIGPIFKTIKEAISPVGLWYASRIFSEITKNLCIDITRQYPDSMIFSPYFSGEGEMDDGIGKYHDRILFACSEINRVELSNVIKTTKRNMAIYLDVFEDVNQSDLERFLADYLQINFCIFDETELVDENIVFKLNKALDALELMAVSQQPSVVNYFEKIFVGRLNHRNFYIKSSPLYTNITQSENFLWHNTADRFRSITDISKSDMEGNLPYFAVVNSDGDKFGRLLKEICSDNKTNSLLSLEDQVARIKEFSRCCLIYAQKAAKRVNDAGGMVIYAGGDDLLFLAPINSLFSLCQELKAIFRDSFAGNAIFPQTLLEKLNISLSFGMTIHYEKFPLYEAIEEATTQMYASKAEGGNQIRINITKHSGQAIQLSLNNDCLKSVEQLVKIGLSEEVLQSLAYKVGELRSIFSLLFTETIKNNWDFDTFKMLFCNAFDNNDQKESMNYLEMILNIYYHQWLNDSIDDHVSHLQSLLFLIKFWNKGR